MHRPHSGPEPEVTDVFRKRLVNDFVVQAVEPVGGHLLGPGIIIATHPMAQHHFIAFAPTGNHLEDDFSFGALQGWMPSGMPLELLCRINNRPQDGFDADEHRAAPSDIWPAQSLKP
jgi:hypothetical protein